MQNKNLIKQAKPYIGLSCSDRNKNHNPTGEKSIRIRKNRRTALKPNEYCKLIFEVFDDFISFQFPADSDKLTRTLYKGIIRKLINKDNYLEYINMPAIQIKFTIDNL